MSIQLKSSSKGHRLILSGEIDFGQVNELYQVAQQIAENPKPITVEWGDLTSIHYAGVQTLLALGKTLQHQGVGIRYKEPAPQLYAQLQRFGLWQALLNH